MHVLIAVVLACCTTGYEGKGILNLVVVGEDYKLEDVKEIKNFSALFFESLDGEDDLSFLLTLDGDVRLKHPDGGLLPTLILSKDGKTLASVHLHVSRYEKENELFLEWRAVPDLLDDSYCFIQMYPGSEKMVTLKIPFSAATVKRVTKEKELHTTTIAEVRQELAERSKEKKEQAGADSSTVENTNEKHAARPKRVKVAPKNGTLTPTTVTLHTFAIGVFDADGKFTPTDTIPYEIGVLFGYELWVYATAGKVRVKAVLDLPEPGIWDGSSEDVPEGVKMLDVRTMNEDKTHVQEFELHGGKKAVKFGQEYEIVKGDPDGEYKFMIYLDGQLAEEVKFQVGEDR